jgi:hypothetical protein
LSYRAFEALQCNPEDQYEQTGPDVPVESKVKHPGMLRLSDDFDNGEATRSLRRSVLYHIPHFGPEKSRVLQLKNANGIRGLVEVVRLNERDGPTHFRGRSRKPDLGVHRYDVFRSRTRFHRKCLFENDFKVGATSPVAVRRKVPQPVIELADIDRHHPRSGFGSAWERIYRGESGGPINPMASREPLSPRQVTQASRQNVDRLGFRGKRYKCRRKSA